MGCGCSPLAKEVFIFELCQPASDLAPCHQICQTSRTNTRFDYDTCAALRLTLFGGSYTGQVSSARAVPPGSHLNALHQDAHLQTLPLTPLPEHLCACPIHLNVPTLLPPPSMARPLHVTGLLYSFGMQVVQWPSYRTTTDGGGRKGGVPQVEGARGQAGTTTQLRLESVARYLPAPCPLATNAQSAPPTSTPVHAIAIASQIVASHWGGVPPQAPLGWGGHTYQFASTGSTAAFAPVTPQSDQPSVLPHFASCCTCAPPVIAASIFELCLHVLELASDHQTWQMSCIMVAAHVQSHC